MGEPIKYYLPNAAELFGKNSTPKRISHGYQFAEGPVWHPSGYLLFSDVKANRIFQLFLNGVIHVVLHHSGSQYVCAKYLSDMVGSNGLALNKEGELIFCQHANHSIARLDKNKNVVQLCTSFNQRPFNSPNDIVIRSDGGIYFTDPPYGLKKSVLNPGVFQPHSGIYRFRNNKVELLATDLGHPNGIAFSHNERFLFVSSNHPEEKKIFRYALNAEGDIAGRRVIAAVNADGVKTDAFDNIYAATEKGVLILSKEGNELALISLPEPATNLTFGGPQRNLLFVTTFHSVYLVEMNSTPQTMPLKETFYHFHTQQADDIYSQNFNMF